MPGDTLRHWKAPSFGYFRLAKEVHAVQVCAFVHLSPFLFFLKKITLQKYETIRQFFQVFEILSKNTCFCNILKIFSGKYYRFLKMFVSMVLLWEKDSDRNNLTR